MGREALCTGRLGAKKSTGKALLETDELIFRGDFRVVVPFKAMTRVSAGKAGLTVVWPEGTLVLALGEEAAKWAERIRHPPSRLDKLGVKADSTVALVGDHASDELRAFAAEVAARGARIAPDDGAGARATARAPSIDILFLAAESRADLDHLAALKRRIQPAGAIWVLRPKGSAAITERDVLAAGKAAGLVDVKVAAFSPTRSAAKLVIPVAKRPAARAKRPR